MPNDQKLTIIAKRLDKVCNRIQEEINPLDNWLAQQENTTQPEGREATEMRKHASQLRNLAWECTTLSGHINIAILNILSSL